MAARRNVEDAARLVSERILKEAMSIDLPLYIRSEKSTVHEALSFVETHFGLQGEQHDPPPTSEEAEHL